VKFFELAIERMHRHESEVPRNLSGGFPSFQFATGHYHALKLHPGFRRKPNIADEKGVEVAVATPKRCAHICDSVAFAEGKALEAVVDARERLDNAPCLI